MLVLSVVILIDSAIQWYGYLIKKKPITTTEVIVYANNPGHRK